MPSAAEIERHFASGAETFTFTRAEWEAFYALQQQYSATGLQLGQAQAETERVKRIARPLWRAVARVRREMARALESRADVAARVTPRQVQEWERVLRYAQDVDWKDLPAGHRRHAEFGR